MKIPVPRFVVFYNGTDGQPERQILWLSDAFEKETAEPELELKVLMLNINFGHNQELMDKCQTLKEYSQYVDRVRKYAKRMQIEEAVERAVTECIREGILADFLSSQRAEVIAVSIFEYNEEEEMRKIRDSEYKSGKEDGIACGEAETIISLIRKKSEKGFGINEIATYSSWMFVMQRKCLICWRKIPAKLICRLRNLLLDRYRRLVLLKICNC